MYMTDKAHRHPRSWSAVDRRKFLAMSGLSGAAVMLGTGEWSTTNAAEPAQLPYPFTLGVASGDPRPGGFVLWTRLAPRPLEEGGRGGMGTQVIRVEYEVATDRLFSHIVRRGSAEATPELGHSVHPGIRGLEPDHVYFYRFRAGGNVSPVGRTRTTPVGHARELAFAFVSCQKWSSGYFTAYRHLAQDDLDLVVHLGDYIYEYGIPSRISGRQEIVPDHFGQAAKDLAGYRLQYALTKSDPDLQLAHRRFPWLITLDDHEVSNGWDGDNTAPEFLSRRAAAFQAWYENLPLRAAQQPRGADMQVYRRLRYGDLATFHVLDTRQYRDNQACTGHLETDCDERFDPSRTIMGPEQEAWLLQGLGASTARWDVLANQATMGQNDLDPAAGQRLNMDMWDGYAANRDRVLRGAVRQGARDLVVLTGDKHVNVALNLHANFDDPASRVVGTELIGTSVTSGGDGEQQSPFARSLLAGNAHMKYINCQRGYVRCRVTPERYEADFRVVDHVEDDRKGTVRTDATAVIEHGTAGLAGPVA
jgi:alkaline phosphatase D